MKHTLSLTTIGLLAVSLACAPANEKPAQSITEVSLGAEADAAASVVTMEMLREPIAELASDDYAGRGPGSEGDAMAQEYLIGKLGALGLRPGASDGSWLQPFEMVSIESSAPETWTFSRDGSSIELAWWEEFIASSAVQEPVAEIDKAELVLSVTASKLQSTAGTTSRTWT